MNMHVVVYVVLRRSQFSFEVFRCAIQNVLRPTDKLWGNLGLFMAETVCRSGRKAKVVEIGVWRGEFAQLLLERYSVSECVMIEPAEKRKLNGHQTPELSARLKEFPA